jgi:hypothetical protein
MANASASNILNFNPEGAELIETDEQILERQCRSFSAIKNLTEKVKEGALRAMIVSGPPGIGKSFGIEEVLTREDLFNSIADRAPNYDIVKGNCSALGLYMTLYKFSKKGQVVFFDDTDALFTDENALNILKAACESTPRRRISWNTDNRSLKKDNIPTTFMYEGSCMFATNVKLDASRSKKFAPHYAAIRDRCFYMDLGMDSPRERMLRIRQVVSEGMLEDRYGFDDDTVAEILDYVEVNSSKLRGLSLRTVVLLADLVSAFPNDWKKEANQSLLIKGAK